ncbi:MAG: T9SS type A sorting domain-containing protein, partial [Bacteroidales bacterium]|nr:T9SS type A sorting domain-containing protein [Bacteroidales bacterium]
ISTYNIVPPNSINCFNDRPNENFYKITWIATPNGHGVTEGGSSGSPLFNSDRRIIGQLYGPGYCSNFNCSDPANDISNYGKIFASWNGNSANQRLRDWLNPENNVLTWNGINGCGQGVAVNLNITHTITSGSVELHQATNTITASNTIEAGATTTYEAQTIVLKDGFVAEAGSNFVTRSVDFNCVVTCDPINVVSWTNYICRNDILCFLVSNASTYTVKINTLNGVLVHQGSGNASSTTVCVWDAFGVASGTYIATVSFSNDCQEISNTYQVVVGPCLKSFEEEAEKEGEKEETHTLSVYDTSQLDFNFIVFPNPNDGSFSLIINNDIDMPYSLEIINSDGKIIYCIEQLNAIQINISQTGLPKGSYFVRIKSANKISTQKVIIQ